MHAALLLNLTAYALAIVTHTTHTQTDTTRPHATLELGQPSSRRFDTTNTRRFLQTHANAPAPHDAPAATETGAHADAAIRALVVPDARKRRSRMQQHE